ELLGHLPRNDGAATLLSEGLAERAYVLAMLERLEEAVAACAELERRFTGVSERKLRNRVGWAIATQAAHLKDLVRPAESLAAARRRGRGRRVALGTLGQGRRAGPRGAGCPRGPLARACAGIARPRRRGGRRLRARGRVGGPLRSQRRPRVLGDCAREPRAPA